MGYRPHSFQAFYIGHKLLLPANVINIHLIAVTSGQRIISLKNPFSQLFTVKEVLAEAVPGLVFRNIYGIGHFFPSPYLFSQLLHSFFGNPFLKKNGNSHILFHIPHSAVNINHCDIKNPEQENTGRHGHHRSRCIYFIVPYIFQTETDEINEIPKAHIKIPLCHCP